MNKEIAMRWADELESGRWVQTHDYLKIPGMGHCCLGVCCEMAKSAGVEVKEEMQPGFQLAASFDGKTEEIPESVRKWAGMRSSVGVLPSGVATLSSENDEGSTFPEIAALIRKHWEAL